VLRVLRFGWFVFFARCEYWGWLIWVFFAYGIEGGRIKGWSGLKKIILGARQHILDGAVREILAEEAGRKTITEWRVSTNSVMLGETWQIMGLILHTNSGKAAINGFSGSRRGGLIWIWLLWDEALSAEATIAGFVFCSEGSVDLLSIVGSETSNPTVGWNKTVLRTLGTN